MRAAALRTTILNSAFAVSLLVPTAEVMAATRTWTGGAGAGDTSWTTPANWGGTAPTSADIANIPNTANQPTVTTSTAAATDVRLGSTATSTT